MRFIRVVDFWWQRMTRGWDDSETWSLDHTFQEWIVPRLERYSELERDRHVMSPEFWQAIDEMLEGFRLDASSWKPEERKKVQKAYDQFAKWHEALWW
jgi:hypothetical protein